MRCHHHLRHSNFPALPWLLFSHILVYFLCIIAPPHYLQDYWDLGRVEVTERKITYICTNPNTNKQIILWYKVGSRYQISIWRFFFFLFQTSTFFLAWFGNISRHKIIAEHCETTDNGNISRPNLHSSISSLHQKDWNSRRWFPHHCRELKLSSEILAPKKNIACGYKSTHTQRASAKKDDLAMGVGYWGNHMKD